MQRISGLVSTAIPHFNLTIALSNCPLQGPLLGLLLTIAKIPHIFNGNRPVLMGRSTQYLSITSVHAENLVNFKFFGLCHSDLFFITQLLVHKQACLPAQPDATGNPITSIPSIGPCTEILFIRWEFHRSSNKEPRPVQAFKPPVRHPEPHFESRHRPKRVKSKLSFPGK